MAPFSFFFLVADEKEEPRILGLAMVPGKHIMSIEIDEEWLKQSLSWNIHQIKKNNLDGFNVEVFYNSAVRWFIYSGSD